MVFPIWTIWTQVTSKQRKWPVIGWERKCLHHDTNQENAQVIQQETWGDCPCFCCCCCLGCFQQSSCLYWSPTAKETAHHVTRLLPQFLSSSCFRFKREAQIAPTWITLPYWITVPSNFLFSVSFCFFSRSAACCNNDKEDWSPRANRF